MYYCIELVEANTLRESLQVVLCIANQFNPTRDTLIIR